MLKGEPFPKFHGRAAETKWMLEPVAAFLKAHKNKGKKPGGEELESMIKLLDWSQAIDVLVGSLKGYGVTEQQGEQLEMLVYNYKRVADQIVPHLP